MNLREVLSSRSMIPAALALPINREPADIQSQTESMRQRREAMANEASSYDEYDKYDKLVEPVVSVVDRRTVSFYL